MDSTPLNAAERDALAGLADGLIPASPKGLSASEAGVAGDLLDALERLAPERLALLRHAISFAGGSSPAAALDAFRRQDPAAYDSFCETIAAVYFMAPKVREAVGFPGRLAQPARIDVSDIEDLLMPVFEGGFGPREIPAQTEQT